MNIFLILTFLVYLIISWAGDADSPEANARSEKLENYVNQFRKIYGQKPLPTSPSLRFVSQLHTDDLLNKAPNIFRCGYKSWSDEGTWEGMCYRQSRNQTLMTMKPSEVTSYISNGYELVLFANPFYREGGDEEEFQNISATLKNDPNFKNVVLEKGEFAGDFSEDDEERRSINRWPHYWKNFGCGYNSHFAVCWFGRADIVGRDFECGGIVASDPKACGGVGTGLCQSADNCKCWPGKECQINCHPACVHGKCKSGNICECDIGYEGDRCDVPICSPPCVHGNCDLPDHCTCEDLWGGKLCNVPLCDPECLHGGICEDDHVCNCQGTGYEGDHCQTPVCNPSCVHGECEAPNACKCESGWEGESCDLPICSPPCVHGKCDLPDHCECEDLWGGKLCNVPLCDPECLNGGICKDDHSCDCTGTGYEGDHCQTPVCDPTCVHGDCEAPNQCNCESGWEGEFCDVPICTPVCMNGGICEDDHTCNCQGTGYEGDHCQTPVCDPTCVHGDCVSPNRCQCESGWSGETCDIPVCTPECLHGGKCTDEHTCDCEETGYHGDQCEIENCSPEICIHGTCISEMCECEEGWSGTKCDIPICDPICEHGGICKDDNTCDCSGTGYGGEYCQTPICDPLCDHGVCTSPDVCLCETGWTGNLCDEPVCSPDCLHGGVCETDHTCNCGETGYEGDHCQTPICDPICVNGNCTAPNVCTCKAGWEGDDCNTPICSISCEHGGICVDPDVCDCGGTGYVGDHCQIPICSPACVHGHCESPNNCQCDAQWEGEVCDIPICDPVCLNGGVCKDDHTCDCTNTGYSGDHCETPICTPPCVHGTCDEPDHCQCESGWTGETCDSPICSPTCLNGGICENDHTCNCDGTGYIGDHCENAICNPVCIHGTCTTPGECTCDSGWTGDTCETPICSPACVHGTCYTPNVCQCEEGWTGNLCDEPVCSPDCMHGGVCETDHSCNCDETGYEGDHCQTPTCDPICVNGNCTAPNVCTCKTGWEGDDCNTPICVIPCEHGGICVEPDKCDCGGTGYVGDQCQTPFCDPSCVHGICEEPDICKCDAEWTGPVCDNPICDPECLNGGICKEDHTCDCANTGWIGDHCQTPVCDETHQCVHGNCSAPNSCTCDPRYGGNLCNECEETYYTYEHSCVEHIDYEEPFFSGTSYFYIYYEIPAHLIEGRRTTKYPTSCEDRLGSTRTLFGQFSSCDWIDENEDGMINYFRVSLSSDAPILSGGKNWWTYVYFVTEPEDRIIVNFKGLGGSGVNGWFRKRFEESVLVTGEVMLGVIPVVICLVICCVVVICVTVICWVGVYHSKKRKRKRIIVKELKEKDNVPNENTPLFDES